MSRLGGWLVVNAVASRFSASSEPHGEIGTGEVTPAKTTPECQKRPARLARHDAEAETATTERVAVCDPLLFANPRRIMLPPRVEIATRLLAAMFSDEGMYTANADAMSKSPENYDNVLLIMLQLADRLLTLDKEKF